MPKRTWNSFVTDHLKTTTTASGVSLASFPKGPILDKNRKILPTPYTLVRNWIAKTLTGDWTTKKDGNAFIILVATAADAALVLKKLPAGGSATRSKIADRTYPVSFRADTFAALAKDAGYAVNA
jgi:hypothetical protein